MSLRIREFHLPEKKKEGRKAPTARKRIKTRDETSSPSPNMPSSYHGKSDIRNKTRSVILDDSLIGMSHLMFIYICIPSHDNRNSFVFFIYSLLFSRRTSKSHVPIILLHPLYLLSRMQRFWIGRIVLNFFNFLADAYSGGGCSAGALTSPGFCAIFF